MKKTIWGVLACAVLAASVTACSGGAKETGAKNETVQMGETVTEGESAPGGQADSGMPWNIEPLAEKTKLTVSYLANSTPELTTYIAREKGWLDALNLDVELVYFAGGPAQMEASGSWDVATTGIGGVITGILNSDVKILGVAARDKGLFQAFFARKDSDIVKDGTGFASVEGVYGKPESWKGKDILTAVGTTNAYTLYNTLNALGLGLTDVNVINMDIASATTAFLAGQGDVVGVQGTMIYDDVFQKEDSEYVCVSSDQMLGCGLSVNYVATAAAWADKQAAVRTWLEVVSMAGDWANENQQEAAEIMTEMYREDGYETKVEDNLKTIQDNPFTTLEENYTYATKSDENGVLQMKAQIYDAMVGYIAMGNYKEEQLEQLKAKDNFILDPIMSIYSAGK